MVAGLPYRDNPHVGNRWVYRDVFNRIPAINADITVATSLDWELLGTNAVSADLSFHALGGFNLATHGGTNDSAILLPHLDTKQTGLAAITFLSENQPQFVAHVKTAAALTNTTLWAGLKKTNTPVSTTDDDEIFFRYQNGTDTTWKCVYDIANAGPTSVDSGISLAAATDFRLWINVDAARVGRFFINGNLVATTPALTAGVTLIPYIGVLSATDASVKTLIVRSVELSIAL